MTLLRAILALAAVLALQTGLGRLWPEGHRYVDVMLVPVVMYAISTSQMAGMLVGCASGLLADAWLQTGVFGIGGFKKTLIGYAVGGLGSRFDLNRSTSRFAFGTLAGLADGLIDVALRRLLDRAEPPPVVSDMLIKAAVTGLLVIVASAIVRSARHRAETRYRM